jgi:imidazoleglycerol-phosphate dehydratase/histidinol-phosphatase
MVTNQDGLGTASYPEEDFLPPHTMMLNVLASEGVTFREICIDRSFEHEGKETRKPGIGMLTGYLNGDWDIANSFVIGDRKTDVDLARNLGAGAILVQPECPAEEWARNVDLATTDWHRIASFLLARDRSAEVRRTTRETDIRVQLTLEGEGKAAVNTGIGFFDHMLEQIARHASIDLEVYCKGDLHIDEHHTVEDTALALGEALKKALGNRRGITRYAFVLPMDEALATVALDLGGRPHLEWDVALRRERVGELPTELVPHFFRSISTTLGATLHISAKGENDHHIIESTFKGFAKTLGQAVRRTDSLEIPSTKGIL